MWDQQQIIKALLGALALICAWLFREVWKRLHKLEQTYVSKSDLDDLERRMTDQRERLHEENRDKLDNIEEGVTVTHRRIDQLYRDLLGRER